ncbi:hypothetical protein GJ496_002244 [Pomphorhynchus laevis]|nr:hypothetical protein GJ496_002244 [Pomphorhynchus laevis]
MLDVDVFNIGIKYLEFDIYKVEAPHSSKVNFKKQLKMHRQAFCRAMFTCMFIAERRFCAIQTIWLNESKCDGLVGNNTDKITNTADETNFEIKSNDHPMDSCNIPDALNSHLRSKIIDNHQDSRIDQAQVKEQPTSEQGNHEQLSEAEKNGEQLTTNLRNYPDEELNHTINDKVWVHKDKSFIENREGQQECITKNNDIASGSSVHDYDELEHNKMYLEDNRKIGSTKLECTQSDIDSVYKTSSELSLQDISNQDTNNGYTYVVFTSDEDTAGMLATKPTALNKENNASGDKIPPCNSIKRFNDEKEQNSDSENIEIEIDLSQPTDETNTFSSQTKDKKELYCRYTATSVEVENMKIDQDILDVSNNLCENTTALWDNDTNDQSSDVACDQSD